MNNFAILRHSHYLINSIRQPLHFIHFHILGTIFLHPLQIHHFGFAILFMNPHFNHQQYWYFRNFHVYPQTLIPDDFLSSFNFHILISNQLGLFHHPIITNLPLHHVITLHYQFNNALHQLLDIANHFLGINFFLRFKIILDHQFRILHQIATDLKIIHSHSKTPLPFHFGDNNLLAITIVSHRPTSLHALQNGSKRCFNEPQLIDDPPRKHSCYNEGGHWDKNQLKPNHFPPDHNHHR